MVSKKQDTDTLSLNQLSEWITNELTSQVETINHLSGQVETLNNFVEVAKASEKTSSAKPSKAWLPYACSFDVTCLPPLVPNLYSCEFTADKHPYRWTGPDRSTQLTFSVNRTVEKQLEIKFLGAVHPDVLTVVNLYVDRLEVPVKVTDSRLTATLPAKQNSSVETEIILTLATTLSPSSLNSSKDTRLLGIAISGLSIK